MPLVAVLFLSGCVGQGSVGVGKGLEINDLSVDFNSVDSGEKVTLYLKVSNTGSTEAKNVKAEIAGIDVREWKGKTTESLGDLLPVDPQSNTPGETQTRTFDLNAPTLAKGLQVSYEPIVYVSYDYEATTVKALTLVDIDELRRMEQQGRGPSVKTKSSTGGPISVEIQAGEYVKTGTSSEAYNRFPLYITITNNDWGSGGTVIPASGRNANDYPVQLTIDLPSQLSASDCKLRDTINLWKGQNAEITCDMRVTRPPQKREDVLITVKMDYRYQIEASTSITVTGTK
ncbi:MAG: hypothetical protein ABIH90_03085 [Candidatus Aenigmatarchaeota archaeon]